MENKLLKYLSIPSKSPDFLIFVFFLGLFGSISSQELKAEKNWVFVSAKSSPYLEKGCPKTVLTKVFSIPKLDEGYVDFNKNLIKDALKDSLEFTKYDISLYDIGLHVFDNVDEARQDLDIQFNNALVDREIFLTKIDNAEADKRCEPVLIEWAYKGHENTFLKNIQLLSGGWKVADSTDIRFINQFLNQSGNEFLKREEFNHLRARKNLLPWNKSLLYEVQITVKGKSNFIFNILKSEKESFIINKKKGLHRYFKKNPPQRLTSDRYLLEYLELCVNSSYNKDGRYRIVTREGFQSYFKGAEITPANLTFKIVDPKIIYSNKEISLVSAMIHYKKSLYFSLIQIDKQSGEFSLKEEVTLKKDVKAPTVLYMDGIFFFS